MGISTVVNISSRGLDQVVHSLLIHIGGADAAHVLLHGHQAGPVKGIQHHDLTILHLHHIPRLHHPAAVSRNAVAQPFLNTFFRPDERHVIRTVLHHSGRKERIDMIVVIMGGENRVHLGHCEGIVHNRSGAQVGLGVSSSGHVAHLVEGRHLLVLLGALAVPKPQVNGNVGAVLRLEPHARAADPPHCEGAWLNHFVVDLLIQPGSPLRERTQNPFLSCEFFNLTHSAYSSFLAANRS